MVTNADLARIVASDVALLSVVLKSATVSSNVDPLSEQPADLDTSQQYRGRYDMADPGGSRLDVSVDFRFVATDPGGEQSDLFSLDATYLLIYQVKNLSEKPADALKYFAQLNGPYNVWPYWRELVQTVTGRIGLGSILVPVFRPPVRELKDAEGGDEPEAPIATTVTKRKRAEAPTGTRRSRGGGGKR